MLALEPERRTAGTPETHDGAAARLLKRAGTRLSGHSGDVELVSRLLGHASIATSTISITRSNTKLARALASWDA